MLCKRLGLGCGCKCWCCGCLYHGASAQVLVRREGGVAELGDEGGLWGEELGTNTGQVLCLVEQELSEGSETEQCVEF